MLTVFVIALQIVLPLALLVWLAFASAASLTGLALQAAGVGLFLLALARIAMWTVPPWWTPYLYGILWLLIVLRHVAAGGLAARPLWPSAAWGWAGAGLALALAVFGGWFSGMAVLARAAPPVATVDIANPLGPGRYVVGHGGSRGIVNAHLKVLDTTVARHAEWRGQAYAVDLFAVDRLGLRADGWRPRDPARYAIFDRPVHAPCAGTVIGARNDLPDMPVPDMDAENLLGNHVLLRCAEAVLLFAHLRQGSVGVAAGETVARGALLGRVGNSGNTSEPHLHLHAQRLSATRAPVAGAPLALRIDGRRLVRNDRLAGRDW